ncbi:insulinase family protein [Oscillibacter sp.]|uniref:EF-P 5-aminopentanol modification-associated protein YfmF n=1 Tax=Oscillibacter sp. TaxID=1945593 RepID=UPI00339111E6
MEATRIRLAEGVYLTHLPARKFKTSLLSAQFLTRITAETAAAQALLPAVLRRGTVRYPDMGTLSARLDGLYGAVIDYTVRKKGESQCVGFVASLIDDAFTPDGEKLLEPVAELLGQLICNPTTKRGLFLPEYVESERTNLVDAIRSILNDKREYADLRLLQEMCDGEPYGVSQFGDEKTAETLTVERLQETYVGLLASAPLELFYCGSAEVERVKEALLKALSTLPRTIVRSLPRASHHVAREEVRRVTDAMDVTQGKLGMGFTCGSDDFSALMMGNTLFGGSSNSKLFMNVREKLSLCYYASSLFHWQKGIITVSSGIEFQNFQRAYDEIQSQMKAVQDGKLEEWELTGARSTLCNAYATIGDSQSKLENFWLGRVATGRDDTPEELAEGIRTVSSERIYEAMRTVSLDTVYFLKGEGAEE